MSSPDAPQPTGYLRVLTRFDATMIVVGSIIGAGVFFTPQTIAAQLMRPDLILTVWVIGGVIALTGALTYAELGGMFQRAGGVYVFLREALGPLPAFLYGWALLLVIAPGALALVADFFADNLIAFVPALKVIGSRGIAIVTILALTVTNVRGVRLGSTLQNVVTIAKLLALLLLIGGGLTFTGEPLGDQPAQLVEVDAKTIALAMAAALIPVMFSYGGWQNGTYIAGEMRRPQRDVPVAIIAGTLLVITTYVLVNIAYLNMMTPATVASVRSFASLGAVHALGPIGGNLVAGGIVISTFGICAAILLTNPRVAQAIGEDGLFFKAFGRLHPRFHTPHVSIIVLGVWSCVLLVVGRAEQLLDSVVFADWVFFTLSAVCLFVFRKTRPDVERPYRCALYPVVPALFILLAASLAVVSFVKADFLSRLLGPGILAAGVPVYYLFKRRALA